MSDWDEFKESVPWFLEKDTAVETSVPRKGRATSVEVANLFPSLTKLLGKALATDVSVKGMRYELLGWDSGNGERLGWLCLPPTETPPRHVHGDHRELLKCFGGIVERFNEPSGTWLLNLNDALTERAASHDGSFIRGYSMFEMAGLILPIEPTEYYSIACEANGNTTLCHRISGRILMFAPDHSFKHLKELEGCPKYSLYTIDGAPTFRDWVDAVAVQWLAHTCGTV